jgi:hypothetical protein
MSHRGKGKHWTHQDGIAHRQEKLFQESLDRIRRTKPSPRRSRNDKLAVAGKKKFYVVFVGRTTGIFTDWLSCKRQVDGFPQAKFRGYVTEEEAIEALRLWMIPKGPPCNAVNCTHPKCSCK